MEADLAPFVRTVRRYRCLWDTQHASYAAPGARDAAWRAVANRHHAADVAAAKRSWKALRDTHRVATKRQRARGGAGPGSAWRYLNLMQFLVPHIGAKPTRATVATPRSKKMQSTKRPKTNKRRSDKDSTTKDTENVAQPSDIVIAGCKTEPTETRPASEDNSFNGTYYRPGTVPEDPTAKFFAAMLDTARLLPEVYQLEIKRKLFQAVADAEEHYLAAHGY